VVNGQHTVVVRPLSLLAISVSDHEKFLLWWWMRSAGVFEGVVCQVLPTPKGRYAPSRATWDSHLGSDATGRDATGTKATG
jgi:hypothetical protein